MSSVTRERLLTAAVCGMWMSCACLTGKQSACSDKSFTETPNNIGPRIDPCGALYSAVHYVGIASFIRTVITVT